MVQAIIVKCHAPQHFHHCVKSAKLGFILEGANASWSVILVSYAGLCIVKADWDNACCRVV